MNYIDLEPKTVPALHFVSGTGTSLAELANLIIKKTGSGSLQECPPRDYDVHKFIGCPNLAFKELGWKAETGLSQGIDKFISEMRPNLKLPSAMPGFEACYS